MAESVTTAPPTRSRSKSTNQSRSNALIQRRIALALSSKDNTELTQRVRRLERMAALGTGPALCAVPGVLKPTEMGKLITLYRIIYSTPDLKNHIEESVGSIGIRPPIDSAVGVMFDVKPATIDRSFPVFNRKLAKERQLMFGNHKWYTLLAVPVLLYSGFAVALQFWILSFLIIRAFYALRTRGLHANHSRCCSCGISTKDLGLQETRDDCLNCQGTGVCQVGCPSCCPYIVPKEAVAQRLDYLKMLKGNPHLQSRWKRDVGQATIVSLENGGGGGGELSLEEEHKIVTDILERCPDLKQELDAAVAEHKKNNSGDLECNATQCDEASDAPAPKYSTIFDLPTVATDNLLDLTSALLGEDDDMQDNGNLLHADDEEVPIAQLLNVNTGAAGYEMVVAKEL